MSVSLKNQKTASTAPATSTAQAVKATPSTTQATTTNAPTAQSTDLFKTAKAPQNLSNQDRALEKFAAAKTARTAAVATTAPVVKSDPIDRLIDFTARVESGGKYNAWNPNDVGKGVSYGLIQFNQQVGTLPSLMQRMHSANSQKFNEIFGHNAQNMLNSNWVRSANLNEPGIKSAMLKAGEVPEFQRAQRDLAREGYFNPAAAELAKHGLKSERAHAMAFDTAVQMGVGGMRSKLAQALQGGGTEKQILTRFAQIVDSSKYGHNRRTNLLNSTQLSDGPLGSSPAPAPAPSTPSTPAPTGGLNWSTMQKGAKGEQVKQLQQVLVKLGHMTQADMNTGPGTFGPKTDAAVKKFQSAHGLVVDGVVGPQTRGALEKALAPAPAPAPAPSIPTPAPVPAPSAPAPVSFNWSTMKQGAKGQQVKELQYVLKAKGFDPGPVDGDFGPRTAAAVKQFQSAHGLFVDGVVGPKTKAALERAVGGNTGPAPTPGNPPPAQPGKYDGIHPAPGTTETNIWGGPKITPPLSNSASNRSATNYAQVINQFAVGHNPRYQPRSGQTFCNIFAQDVMRQMGAPLPAVRVNDLVPWLHGAAKSQGWRQVSAEEAQRMANQGQPALVTWKNPGGIHGHVGVIRPGEITSRGAAMAQSGSRTFNDQHVIDGFGSGKPLEYWVHA